MLGGMLGRSAAGLLQSLFVLLCLGGHARSLSALDMACVCLAYPRLVARAAHPQPIFAAFHSAAFCPSGSLVESLGALLLLDPDAPATVCGLVRAALRDRAYLVFAALLLACLAVAQAVCCLVPERNLRRKAFHVAALFLFVRMPAHWYPLCQYAIYFLAALAPSPLLAPLFRPFRNEKDYGPSVLSHVLLLAAVVYPRIVLDGPAFAKTLIAVCVLDSAAAVTGVSLGASGKSAAGFLGGQLAAYAAEYALLGSVDVPFYLVAGASELVPLANDNILIPFAAVVFFEDFRGPAGSLAAGWGPSGSPAAHKLFVYPVFVCSPA